MYLSLSFLVNKPKIGMTKKAIFWNDDIDAYYLGHQVSEIWRDRVYAPYLEDKHDLTILDIGANIGMFSLYAHKFAKQIYALEPSLEHFQLLSDMLVFNNIENVKPIRKALYIKSGEFDFWHNPNKTMFSLHTAVSDGSKPEKVEAITLKQLFDQEEITHVDLMKCDIEGTEVELFSGEAFAEVADKIDTIVVEVHDWNQRNPQQIVDAFKYRGFKVDKIPSTANLLVAKRN